MGSLTYLRVGYGKECGEGEAQHHGQRLQLAMQAGSRAALLGESDAWVRMR